MSEELKFFSLVKVIGKGSYGEVWLTKHQKDKKQYVLKKINLNNAQQKERKSAEQESKLLSQLKHPNIVSYKDSFQHDGFLYIAMAYCEGGDLYTKLRDQRGAILEERLIVEWFVQIAMALQYMHERNILHRDLKTQNIFLTRSKIIKVGDLGIARVLNNSNDMATTLIGTPYYMSPELFSNKPYNHKSDVWALGCCAYEMCTLKHAFNARDFNSLSYKILKGRGPEMPRQYSPELLDLIRAMLHQSPEKRPSVNRLLRDPFIRRHIQIFLEGTRREHKRSNSSGSSASHSAKKSQQGCEQVLAPPPAAMDRALPSFVEPAPDSVKAVTPTPSVSDSTEISVELAPSGDSDDVVNNITPRCSANQAARQRRRQRQQAAIASTDNTQNKGGVVPPLVPTVNSSKAQRRSNHGAPAAPTLSVITRPVEFFQNEVLRIVLKKKSRSPVVASVNTKLDINVKEDQLDSVVHHNENLLEPRPLPDLVRANSGGHNQERKSSDLDVIVNVPPGVEVGKDNTDGAINSSADEIEELVTCMNNTLNISSNNSIAQSLEESKEEDEAHVRDVGAGPTDSKADTLSRNNYMQNRLTLLRKDCFTKLGYQVIKQAFGILDNPVDSEIEPLLRDLLGENYQDFASKIWQLKVWEDNMFSNLR